MQILGNYQVSCINMPFNNNPDNIGVAFLQRGSHGGKAGHGGQGKGGGAKDGDASRDNA